MRGVAAEVGVAPMSLYHHVRDRNELLVGMVDHLLNEVPDVANDGTPWRTASPNPLPGPALPRPQPSADLPADTPASRLPAAVPAPHGRGRCRRRCRRARRTHRADGRRGVDTRPRIHHPGGTRAVPTTKGRTVPTRSHPQCLQPSSTTSSGSVADPTRAHPDDPELAWALPAHRVTRCDQNLSCTPDGGREPGDQRCRKMWGFPGPIHLRVPVSTGARCGRPPGHPSHGAPRRAAVRRPGGHSRLSTGPVVRGGVSGPVSGDRPTG